ncbi:MAG: nicotinate-nicotinamide nucleotide adenylyltransferase [Gaiellales bacterium]
MNPPHLGHVAIARAVHAATSLDRVVVVPAGLPPHRNPPQVSPRARLTMSVRAFADLDHVVVSDTEVERAENGEVGYMIDTIEEVIELPSLLGYDDLEVEASLVIGADQVVTLERWHRFADISALAQIIVVRRPDQVSDSELRTALEQLREQWGDAPKLVDMEPVEISSSLVREVASRGDRAGVAALVPDAIVDDVLHLYGPAHEH